MPDANLVWSGDLGVSPAGDLALVDGAVRGQERVLRRLLTNPGDYTWEPSYGGGLGRFVGAVASRRAIEGTIRSQMFSETAVSHDPEPTVSATLLSDGSVFVDITYVDSPSATTQTLTFSVGV